MLQPARASVDTQEAKCRSGRSLGFARQPGSLQAGAEHSEWYGNQSRLRRLPLQRKLAIGSVNDPLEAEADRVAEHVTRMPAPSSATSPDLSNNVPEVIRRCSCGGTCVTCNHETELRRKQAGSTVLTDTPPIVHETLRSPGKPLDPTMRRFMEPRFGRDFGSVRVHTDAQAGESARQIDSLAYTVGNSIVFRSGSYEPHTASGKRLLAHELTHVVQQNSGVVAVRRTPASATFNAPSDESLIQKGWTNVNEPGIVYPQKDDPRKPADLFNTPDGNLVARLPVQTKVFIITEDPVHGWYAVTANTGGTTFGYVHKSAIWIGLPDPEAEIHRIEANETPLGLATRHYKGKGFDVAGKDKRYLVNALVWVNTHGKTRKGKRQSIYKTAYEVAGITILDAGDDRSPWENARLEAGLLIWLPGAAYLNAVYDQVVKAAGSTGSIHVDIWNTIKRVGHYFAYGLAFAGGLVHGFLASLYDAVAGLGSLIWSLLKSIFTAHVVSDVTELADKVESLKWDDVKDAVGAWAAGWDKKLDSDSGWVAGHAHGYLTGYIMAEAAMLLLTGGVLAEIKGAVWTSKVGVAIQKTVAFQRLAGAVEKLGHAAGKAGEIAAKVSNALQKSNAGRAVLAAGRVIKWTAQGIVDVLALPGEIAQYLTDTAIKGLKTLFSLKPELVDRIERLSAAVKRWLFGCHSPCKVDPEAITARLEMTDAQIEKQAAADLESAAATESHPPQQSTATAHPSDPHPIDSPKPKAKPQRAGPVEIGGKRLSRDQVARLKNLRDELNKFHLHWEDIGLGNEAEVNLLFSQEADVDKTIRLLERRARAKIGVRAVHSEAQRPEAHFSRRGKEPLRSEPRPNVPDSQRLPVGTEKPQLGEYGGFWGGERGNSEWFSDVAELNDVTHFQPVRFKNGYPDFEPWAKERVRMTITGRDDTDFAVADRILAKRRGFPNQTAYAEFRSRQKLTWHHKEGANEMILVPTPLHDNVPHIGGASEAKVAAAGKASTTK